MSGSSQPSQPSQGADAHPQPASPPAVPLVHGSLLLAPGDDAYSLVLRERADIMRLMDSAGGALAATDGSLNGSSNSTRAAAGPARCNAADDAGDVPVSPTTSTVTTSTTASTAPYSAPSAASPSRHSATAHLSATAHYSPSLSPAAHRLSATGTPSKGSDSHSHSHSLLRHDKRLRSQCLTLLRSHHTRLATAERRRSKLEAADRFASQELDAAAAIIQELSDAQSRLLADKADLMEQNKLLEDHIASLAQENDESKMIIDTLRDECGELKESALQENSDLVRAKQRALDAEQKASRALDLLRQRDARILQLEVELELAKSADHESALRSLGVSDLVTANLEIERLQALVQEKQAEFEKGLSAAQATEAILAAKESEIEQQALLLMASDDARRTLETRIDELVAENAHVLQAQSDSALLDANETAMELATLHAQLAGKQTVIEALTLELGDLKHKLARLTALEDDSVRLEHSRLATQIQVLQRENAGLRDQLSQRSSSGADLSQSHLMLQAMAEAQRGMLDELRTQAAQLEADKNAETARRIREADAHKETVTALKKEHDMMREAIKRKSTELYQTVLKEKDALKTKLMDTIAKATDALHLLAEPELVAVVDTNPLLARVVDRLQSADSDMSWL